MATKKFWKLTKKQNKLLFVILGISAVVAPSGAIIYSLVSNPSYENKDPWSNAIELNSNLDQYFNEVLSPNRTRFKVGESNDIGIYVNKSDISNISNSLRSGSKWMSQMSEFDLKEMLSGTGVSITDEGKLMFEGNEMSELALLPTILSYPYEGQDKYGDVYFTPSDKERGIFKYNIRFCLRLGIIGFDGNKHDLKKEYDFTLRHDQGTILPVLLSLMNNESVKNFIASNENFSSNESILKGLLKTYYNLEENPNMDFYSQIKPFSGSLKPNEYGSKKANADFIHVKYDSRNIGGLNNFGANLFNEHIGEYDTIETIFNKIGISMPKIENDLSGFKLKNRNSDSWTSMSFEDVNTYKGYVNYGGSDWLGINDDRENSLFQSEHKVFTNKVNIKFLDSSKSTEIYYDQKPYSRASINYNNYNIENDIKDVINGIQYDDYEGDVNRLLSNKTSQIKSSISNIIEKSLSNNGVSTSVFSRVEVSDSKSHIYTPSYGSRKDNTKVYFDKTISFDSVQTNAYFEGSNRITNTHGIPSRTIKDPNGKDKTNLNKLNINVQSGYWDTDTSESEILSNVRFLVNSAISSWINSNNNVWMNTNEAPYMNYKLNGPINGGKLGEGYYTVTISAPNDLWNFMGSKQTEKFYISKAPDPEPEE